MMAARGARHSPVVIVACIAMAACAGEKTGGASAASTAEATTRSAVAAADSATTAGTRPQAVAPPATVAPGAQPARAPALAAGPRRVMLGGVDFTGIGYDRGSLTAPVVMIDLSDFACPYCGEFSRDVYPTIDAEYVKTGKVFFKYVPFIAGNFPNAREATRAVECSADQGGFWPMTDLVYEAQAEWRKSSDPYAVFSRIAGTAGLDTAKLGACYISRRTDARTARATGLASDLGVRVTPSFVVNGRPIQGALPLAEFRKVIDAALLLSSMKK